VWSTKRRVWFIFLSGQENREWESVEDGIYSKEGRSGVMYYDRILLASQK
jgi:hypothetical protein